MSDQCPECGAPTGTYTTTDFRLAAFLASRGLSEAGAPSRNTKGETEFHFGPEAHAIAREYPVSNEARHDHLIRYFHGLTRRR